jgi:type IV pilus assembly protein PilN
MIKVNLLPRRVTRKKMTFIRHLVISALLIGALLVAIIFQWMSYKGEYNSLGNQVVAAEAEKESLQDVHKKKEQHEATIQDLKNRIEVISQIEKGRVMPIHLMDEVTRILNDDTLPIWLSSLSYNGQNLQLDGFSYTNPGIAKFVKNLERSPYIAGVELLYSQKSKSKDREIFKFSIISNIEKAEESS